MSYEWGGAQPPAGTFDGQLHIDAQGTIREFSVANGAWMKRPNYSQVQALAQELGTNGKPVGFDFWNGPLNTTATNQWDDVYNRTFVKVTWRSTGQVQYVAHVSYAELIAWVAANAPQSGGVYTSDGLVEVFEAVSPDMRIARFMSMHRLYGAMRGRKAYHGEYGRGDPQNGIFSRAGWGTRFASWWNGAASIPTQLIQRSYGQTPATDEPRIVWFPNAKHVNKNRMWHEIFLPADDLNGRMVWDTATQTYQLAPRGTYRQDNSSARGNIKWAACEEPGNTIVILDKQTDARDIQGSAWLWPTNVRGPLSLVALIPVVSGNVPTYRAFIAMPVGVTHVTLKVPQAIGAASDFIAVSQYDDSLLSDYRKKITAPDLENPTSDMWRFAVRHAGRFIGQPGTWWRRGIDYQGIPSRMQFYIRNPVTGLRSDLADRQIVKRTRDKNMVVGFFESPMVT